MLKAFVLLCGLLLAASACGGSVSALGDEEADPSQGADGNLDGSGPRGNPATRVVSVVLSYTGDNDLDLTIYQPDGQGIGYYNDPPDSKAIWTETSTVETVTWPSGTAQEGSYEVFVTPYYVNGKVSFRVLVSVDDVEWLALDGHAYGHEEATLRVGEFEL